MKNNIYIFSNSVLSRKDNSDSDEELIQQPLILMFYDNKAEADTLYNHLNDNLIPTALLKDGQLLKYNYDEQQDIVIDYIIEEEEGFFDDEDLINL